jgi:Rrf2 family protein
MLTNTSKYAIRAIIYLELYASASMKKGIKEIAAELDIPSPFLGKILQLLVKHQLLASSKGPHGGFYLNRPAMDIPLMEIIEIIDGKDIFNECAIRTAPCDPDRPCSMHYKLASARGDIRHIFASGTIADLATEFRNGNERIKI